MCWFDTEWPTYYLATVWKINKGTVWFTYCILWVQYDVLVGNYSLCFIIWEKEPIFFKEHAVLFMLCIFITALGFRMTLFGYSMKSVFVFGYSTAYSLGAVYHIIWHWHFMVKIFEWSSSTVYFCSKKPLLLDVTCVCISSIKMWKCYLHFVNSLTWG